MRVISKRKLRQFWEMPGRENSKTELEVWYDVTNKAQWQHFDDVKQSFGARVDLAYGKTVFDIRNNDYRLICSIDYQRHGVLVLWIGTHKEYDELNKSKGKKLKEL